MLTEATDTLPMVEARERLTRLPEELAEDPRAITVTRRGHPVLSIVPYELFSSLMETMEVMSDPSLMAQLRKSVAEIERGETVSWQEAKNELGL